MKKNLKTSLMVGALSLLLMACNQNSNAKAANNETAKTEKTQVQPAASTAASMPQSANNDAKVAKALQDNLTASGVNIKVISAVPTGAMDMYWVTLDGAPPMMTDKSGKYLFQGALVELGGAKPVDISAKMMSTAAKEALAAVDKSEMIIFPSTSGETKAVVYVFSDPTCHYCQKFHAEIADTNAKGIEVRYLAWPRGDNLIAQSEAVWCSSDRNQAMTDATSGKSVTAPTCANPVKKHMLLGHNLGVSGTPAIFAENGTQLGGYLPPAQLAEAAIANK